MISDEGLLFMLESDTNISVNRFLEVLHCNIYKGGSHWPRDIPKETLYGCFVQKQARLFLGEGGGGVFVVKRQDTKSKHRGGLGWC